jgi:hypothetical protein
VGGEGATTGEREMRAERTFEEPTTSFEIPIIGPGLSSFFPNKLTTKHQN